MYGLLLAVFILKLVVISAQPTLTPQAVDVMENSSVILTCTDPTKTAISTSWQTGEHSQRWAYIVSNDGVCTTTGFLTDSMYIGNCSGNGVFTVTIIKADEIQHNKIWRCRTGFSPLSNDVTVYVKVPVKSVDITTPSSNDLMFKVDKTYTFTCKTTYSRPTPSVQWFLQSAGNTYRINATSSDILTLNEKQFISVKNVLNITFGRAHNGGNLFCNGSNDLGVAVYSRKIPLNVTFPPDGPPVIIGAQNGSKYQIVEHEMAHLSCTASGGNPLAHIVWFCLNGNISEMEKSNTVTSSVTWTALRNQQNTQCVCVAEHMFGNRNTSITVDILYPPSTPVFKIQNENVYGMIRKIQNNTLTATCSSRSNPESDYLWINNSRTEIYHQILHVASVQKKDSGHYMCQVNNTMVGSDGVRRLGSSNSSIELQVLFPPVLPMLRYNDGMIDANITRQSIGVIKGDIFTISCLSEANPNPEYKWEDGTRGSASLITALESIDKICTATNIMNETAGQSKDGSASTTLAVSVLYPPAIPTIRLNKSSGNNVTKELKIIERDKLSLICESDGRPSPNYKWYVNDTITSMNDTFIKKNVSRNDSGKYTCYVYNTMTRTFGRSRNGSKNRSIEIDVLYAPEVGPLTNISINEESTLNITCPIRHGNPLNTNVLWSRKRDGKLWDNKQLIILNVSKEDDTIYTCTVFNEMVPTFGSVIKKTVTGEFHLNIFFSAVIINFSVLGEEFKETIVVNESNDVSLSCTAEANPASNIIIRRPTHELISMASNTNTVRHTLRNVSYVNAGQYICTGRNNYTNDIPSISTLILIVKCPPRPSSYTNNDRTVTTILHADVTLKFTAHDFLDEPDKTIFKWFKDNASIEDNVSKYAISSYGLQSYLSIRNITETDFGQYRVRVTNSVGNYLHIYALQAKDKPDVPKDFSYIKDSITGSSVTLMWMPGFNGGYPQNFILLYKRITESYWQNKSIGDTGDRHINYTLLSLFSKNEYQVKMFARNEEGDSAYTDILQFSTKEQTSVLTETDTGNTSGIVAGTMTTLAIVVIVVLVIGVYLFRKRSKQNESRKVYYDHQRNTARVANESSLTYETLNESKRERDLYSQLPATYDQVDAASRERNAYSEIENTEHDMSDYVNMRI